MKILVVYYSFEGNTRFVAQELSKNLQSDILELCLQKEIKTHGFMKFFWGGKQVTMKKSPNLFPFDKNLDEYDVFCIGTPVWAFTYTPAMRTFFKTTNLKNKKIALFCTHEGGMGKTLENMKSELQNNTIIAEENFIRPLQHQEETKAKIGRFSNTIKDAI